MIVLNSDVDSEVRCIVSEGRNAPPRQLGHVDGLHLMQVFVVDVNVFVVEYFGYFGVFVYVISKKFVIPLRVILVKVFKSEHSCMHSSLAFALQEVESDPVRVVMGLEFVVVVSRVALHCMRRLLRLQSGISEVLFVMDMIQTFFSDQIVFDKFSDVHGD